MAFQLPELPYSYDALEPHIDARTMEIHHSKHHQGYTNNLNAALEKHPEFAERSIESLLQNLNAIPEDIRTAVRNNGGGFCNHQLFWKMMSPKGGGEPRQDLGNAIKTAFGSYEGFSDTFRKTAAGQFGSGWGWLVVTGDGRLDIVSTPNQDNPLSGGLAPILGVDVWEHAYYLKYQNRRADYLGEFMSLVNWDYVADLYSQARQ